MARNDSCFGLGPADNGLEGMLPVGFPLAMRRDSS